MNPTRIFFGSSRFSAARGPESSSEAPAAEHSEPRRTVVECRSEAEYACSLLEPDGQRTALPSIAVLAPAPRSGFAYFADDRTRMVTFVATPAMERLRGMSAATLLRTVVDHANAQAGNRRSLCLLIDGDAVALAGAAHALRTGARATILDAVRPFAAAQVEDVDFGILAISTSRLLELGLEEVLEHLAAMLPGAACGILPGHDLSGASDLVARIRFRELEEEHPSALFWGLPEPLPPLPGTSPRVHRLSQLSIDDAVALGREPLTLALFQGHSHNYCFGAGALCTGDPRSADHPLQCAAGRTCIILQSGVDRPIIRTAELHADVVLLDGCMAGAFTEPVRDDPSNLAISLMTAMASAVVATRRLSVTSPLVAAVFWDLARRGLALGEILTRLNGLFPRRLAPYFLYGDPRSVVFMAEKGRPVEALAVREDRGGLVVRLPSPASPMEACRVRHAWLASSNDAAQLHILPQHEDNAPFLMLPAHRPGTDEAELFPFWAWGRPAGPVELLLTRSPPIDMAALERTGDCLEAYEEMSGRSPSAAAALHGQLSPDGPGHAAAAAGKAATDVAGHLAAARSEAMNILGVFGTGLAPPLNGVLAARSRELTRLLRELNERLLDLVTAEHALLNALEERFQQAYRTASLDEAIEALPCPRCGGRLRRRTYRLGSARGSRRCEIDCARCVRLSDVEMGWPMLCMEGIDALAEGESGEVSLTVRNVLDVPAWASARGDVYTGRRRHMPVFDIDDPGTVRVEPGGEARLSFTLKPRPGMRRHGYPFRAFVTLNCRLLVAWKWVAVG